VVCAPDQRPAASQEKIARGLGVWGRRAPPLLGVHLYSARDRRRDRDVVVAIDLTRAAPKLRLNERMGIKILSKTRLHDLGVVNNFSSGTKLLHIRCSYQYKYNAAYQSCAVHLRPLRVSQWARRTGANFANSVVQWMSCRAGARQPRIRAAAQRERIKRSSPTSFGRIMPGLGWWPWNNVCLAPGPSLDLARALDLSEDRRPTAWSR
jgi:hypothetical protein